MRWSHGLAANHAQIASCVVLLAILGLSGCVSAPPDPEPVKPPQLEPVVEVGISDIKIIPAPVDRPVADVAPTPLPDPPTVAIVLTSRQSAYAGVVQQLVERLDNYTIYDLSDKDQPPVSAFRQINDSDSDTIIAIGLRAARSSVTMSESPTVFSQVFNHQDHGLLTPSSRGVAAIAPLEAHFQAWQDVDSSIKRIGTVIGEGHDDLIKEATRAAAKYSMELVVRTVKSDQEAVYQFRRMVRTIDGFWLLPDNRILSERSLQELISQANQHHVPVAVTSEPLLTMGASVSIETVASDIAETIVNIVRMIEAGRIGDVPSVSSLTQSRIVTSDSRYGNRLASKSAPLSRTDSE